MGLEVVQIRTGGDRNFAYLAADTESGQAFAVDPSYWPEKVVEEANERGWTLRYVFNTHRHHDHTNGNETIRHLAGIEPVAHGDREPRSGTLLEDGATLELGSLRVTILHTPGHTEDSICVHAPGAVFTGDTLFVGKVGGTDFGEQAERQYHSLHEKLMPLPDETVVYPGHDVGAKPSSTIGGEKAENPFLLRDSFEDFVDLKRNWLEYKQKHGID